MTRLRFALPLMAVFAIAVSVSIGDTAANGVPATKATNNSQAITANSLKPTACAALNLTAVLVGSGTITGTAASELIIGSSVNDKISGNGGDDCIVGGPGKTTIDGGTGTDVCIGGGGNDSYTNCETQL